MPLPLSHVDEIHNECLFLFHRHIQANDQEQLRRDVGHVLDHGDGAAGPAAGPAGDHRHQPALLHVGLETARLRWRVACHALYR